MRPHNESRPERIHAARAGPFAQSKALVNSPPPRNVTQGYFPHKGTVILWMRIYKHGMITHPMDPCERSVGYLGEYTCDVCVRAPDHVSISPRLHCILHTVMPLHHYAPPELPTKPCSMLLPPLPPRHSLEARE